MKSKYVTKNYREVIFLGTIWCLMVSAIVFFWGGGYIFVIMNWLVLPCSIFHDITKVLLKFNHKTTKYLTLLIQLSDYLQTDLLKVGPQNRSAGDLQRYTQSRKKLEQHRETILHDVYFYPIPHCSHSGASARFISGRFSFHYILIALVQTP